MHYVITLGEGRCAVEPRPGDDETVRVQYRLETTVRKGVPSPFTRQQLIKDFKQAVTEEEVSWITPGYHATVFDLNLLRESFEELKSLNWLRGKVSVEPEIEIKNLDAERNAMIEYRNSQFPDSLFHSLPYERWQATYFFTLLPEQIDKRFWLAEAPVEIHKSLQRFQMDFPDPHKAAFLIMRFRETRVHIGIFEAIRECLKRHGIDALRADEKHYHDDLYHNILTYMHGCGFGVAVFDRVEEEVFNPNISLEVGYLLALQKPICILKDRTLKTLHTDLMGKLYKVFDPLEACATLDAALSNWLRDKALI